jgi:alkanesulfonate monooxygenase SsuD/methylene tetrahydromethanopterin reductase-like flavin-dependent oxidoreductase (luciferase family)
VELGVALPQTGRLADPIAVRTAAEAADELGYGSVWVTDHVDGVLDPVATLTLAATATSRVRLGTSVLVVPRYEPVLLRRTVATLTEVCDGRLAVGLGSEPAGNGSDEAEATALGAALESLADLPRRPPLLLRCASPAALDLVARAADGWNPTVTDADDLAERWSKLLVAAVEHGRAPDALRFVARVEVHIDYECGPVRPAFRGGVDDVVDDLVRIGAAGAHEVIVGLAGDPTLDEALGAYARWAEALESVGSAPAPADA